ncbi:MAG: hypothetical protein ACOY4K_06335 [Pseudomonadota bacterium]
MSDINVIEHLTAPELFRTQTRLAEAAGVKPHTINERLRHRGGHLTHLQMRQILLSAPAMGVTIDAWDFFPDLRPSAENIAAEPAAEGAGQGASAAA